MLAEYPELKARNAVLEKENMDLRMKVREQARALMSFKNKIDKLFGDD